MKIIIYGDESYRGGHYFGKIPLHTKRELSKTLRAGTRKVRMAGRAWNVMKKSPRPYAYKEYWECPRCYWGK